MKKFILAFACLFFAIPCGANPIPIPPPASMPLEDMHIVIQPCGDALHATFTGDYTFDYIPEEVLSMLFPVPPDADNIRVWQDDVGLPWTWSSETYPTILPEMPTIPMIEWLGPFPEIGAVFRVDYEHDLIKRPEEFIFFYAVGTGKYFPTYEKTTTAYFDILIPAGFAVTGVWLDYTPHGYEVIDGHLMITVESEFGPIRNDLIVSLVQTPIYVATDGSDITGDGSPENPFATIQKGIDSALDGHTVIVQPATYTGPGNRDIDFLGKAITVRSIDPNNPNVVAMTIIDCNGAKDNQHRGFYFHSGETSSSLLSGMTITNGYADYGGALYIIYGSSPVISYCIFNNNFAQGEGGGMYNVNGSPQLTNCVFSENSAKYFGGGIESYNSSTKIINSAFINNSAGNSGGGMDNYENNPILANCMFSNNSATQIGGGVFNEWGSKPTLKNCAFYNNSARDGGGMYNLASDTLVMNCTFYKNSTLQFGGGMYDTNSITTLVNCTITANSATYGGNALAYYSWGPLGSSTVRLTNCVLWDGGNEVWNGDESTITITYTDVWGGWPGLGNIDSDPCFANPDANDFHLQSAAGRWNPNTQSWVTDANTSPCIDAGDPSSDWTAELWPHGKRINMGAYGGTPQASMSLSNVGNIADLDNDDSVDYNDLRLFTEKWLNQEVLLKEDLDRNGFVDFIDFAIFGQQWLDVSDSAPGMTYQIDDCEQGASGSSAAGQSGQTRFTVTVEGRYIHFDDVMVANCCTPIHNLWLEMTVNGNLITIYESEELPQHPCFCTCDYLVNANLGPFEVGTYTLEVYQTRYGGGFIGSTTFIIN